MTRPRDGGCLEVVPGSHRWGLATALGGVVPPDQVAARGAEALAVALPVEAGEVVLLHNYVVAPLGTEPHGPTPPGLLRLLPGRGLPLRAHEEGPASVLPPLPPRRALFLNEARDGGPMAWLLARPGDRPADGAAGPPSEAALSASL